MRKSLLVAALLVSGATHAAPPPVLGDAVIPNPKQFLDAAAAYADAVQPGSGAQMRQGNVMLEQMGVDLSAPAWLVIVDPKAAGAEPVILVFSEKDAKQTDAAMQGIGMSVRRVGKQVVCAKKLLLDKVPDAMIKELVGRTLPAKPFARIYMPKVHDAFKKDMEALEKQMSTGPMGESIGGMMQMVWGFVRETKELTAELDVASGQAHLFIGVIGKPGSFLTKLGAAAKPSDFRLVPALYGNPLLGAGSMDLSSLGGLWDAMAQMSAKMMGADPKELAKAWRAYGQLFSGEVAYGMTMKSPTDFRVAVVSEVKDPVGGLAAWEASMTAMASGKKPWFKVERSKGTFKEGSVVADEITLSPTENVPAYAKGTSGATRVGIATVVGNQLVGVQAATAADARAAMKDLLASVKKPPAAPPAMAAGIADAKSRKESLVFLIDPATFVAITGKKMAPGSSPFAIGGAGAPDGLRLRLTVPAQTVKALISAK